MRSGSGNMDKSAIIEFSNKVRDKLNAEVRSQAAYYGIFPKEIHAVEEHVDSVVINGSVFNSRIKNQRSQLVKQIKEKGYEQVMEEVTYTWFNRLVALKFMEMNGCLQDQIKVFTSTDPNKPEPDLLTNALKLDFLNLNRDFVLDLKAENKDEELYKYLILKLCNYLNKIMPFLFEKIEDYTELLFPDKLLHTGSVLHDLNLIIPTEDWQEVEIIGWIYQDYIAPKKDKVFADLKKNIKISRENIPAATQLFTPKWIVSYLVENSLGRIWLESNPDPVLQAKFKYFIEKNTSKCRKPIYNPEEIKVLDPAMGSGHILVYAFEVLYEIYRSVGYLDSEIALLIIDKNLYGFEIDDRAAQLAGFAVMMKAREYDKDLFSKDVKLNLFSIQETNNINNLDKKKYPELGKLLEFFFDAKDYGSILKPSNFDIEEIYKEIDLLNKEPNVLTFIDMEDILKIINQTRLMNNMYDCVITNPPYMGSNGMNPKLSKFIKTKYPISKSDMFSVFIERCLDFTKEDKFTSMITMQSWLFLSSFEKLRLKIISKYHIQNMIHIGFNSFPELNSKFALGVGFIIQKCALNEKSVFINLNDASKTSNKETVFFAKKNNHELFFVDPIEFKEIEGTPIAYWTTKKIRNIFKESRKFSDIAAPKQGLATTDNNRYLRLWYEVIFENIGFNFSSREEAKISKLRWFPHNKGGLFRKWYGNYDYIINFENDGFEIKRDVIKRYPYLNGKADFVVKNQNYYFKEGITWSSIGLTFGARYLKEGFIFNISGPSAFPEKNDILYLLSYLSSKLANNNLKIISQTLNFEQGNISRLPIIFPKSEETKIQIDLLAQECINISREEWDFHETSWDFKINELLHCKSSSLIEDAYSNFCTFWKEKFFKLHANEEILNRIFIDIYNLSDEMTPEVQLEDITILRDEVEIKDGKLVFKKDIIVKQFLSYAIGCMFGRYSPEKEGLILANQGEKLVNFEEKVPGASFMPDEDNIIPVLDDEYYADDIVGRFKEFLKFTFGAETLSENLDFIAGSISKKNESPEKVIRNYFLNDFYSDHVKMYKKRPIYWLFTSSEKGKVFNALVYMHRYDKTTLAKMRIDYLLDFESKLDAQRSLLEKEIAGNSKNSGKAESELAKLNKKINELVKYDELLKNKADQMIEIDLDDGVVENYKKFEGLVGKI